MIISCGEVTETKDIVRGYPVIRYACACHKVQGSVMQSALYETNTELWLAKLEHARQSLQALHDQVEDPLS